MAANFSSPGYGSVFPIRIRIQDIQYNTGTDPIQDGKLKRIRMDSNPKHALSMERIS